MANLRARFPRFGAGTLVCLLLLSATALADYNARIVRLSYAEGDVRLDRGDGRGFERGLMNMPVAHGNRVWTRDQALAEIEFEDGDTIRLTPETLVILHQLSLRSNGVRVSVVELQEGEAYFRLRHNDDNDFRILLPGRELELRKSSRLRLFVKGQQVELAVMNGEVEIRGQGERLLVKKGETLTLDPNDPDRYYLARSIQEGSYDEWDKDRDSYRDRYASSSYGGYSPYYSYGVSDLHYYGNYFHHPSYGYLWRPHYVGFGWSPFDHGAWVFYPGYGYVWVSAYPWGWIPYRYGSWYYINGYGWCWQRGHNWNRWSAFNRVHHAPRHFVAPVVPQEKNRGIVNVGNGAEPIFPDGDRRDRGAPSRRVFNVTGDDGINRGSKNARGRGGITPLRPTDTALGDAANRTGKNTTGRGGITPLRPTDTAMGDAVNSAGKNTTGRGGITPLRPSTTSDDDVASRPGKNTRDRGGITPQRLPSAGDPDSEVVGKRSSGEPIVFPTRSAPSTDDVEPQRRDFQGGTGNRFRESSPSDSGSGRSSDSRTDDRQRGRVMDSGRSSSQGKSYASETSRSATSGSQRQSTPRAERSSSPSRSYSSGSSSPSRSYSSGASSPSRSYSGNSGGGGRSSGGSSGGGSSRGSSSGSVSKGSKR